MHDKENIKKASEVISNVAHNTPLMYSYTLSDMTGANVYLKLENLQRTGSFKIRGAYNKLWKIKESTKSVIAASAGNHAQGVALAAKLLGIKATLVMPEGTPINKVIAVKELGAEIVLRGKNFDEAYDAALEIEKKSEHTFIHPFDDYDIICGQGTIGMEILNALDDIDAILVPVGGGGLISGIALSRGQNDNIRIYGVESENVPAMWLSLQNKSITIPPLSTSLADGIAVKNIGKLTFKIVSEHVEEVFTVNESEIEDSLLILSQHKKLVVEGAGAVGLAGLIKNAKNFKGRNVVIVISGGNIDVNVLAKIIDRGMVKSGRLMKLEIELPDTPGALGRLSTLLGDLRANVIHIYHDRLSKGLPLDKAIVEITLETRSFDHQKEIMNELEKLNYQPSQLE